jgi:hypothetical protein
MLVACRLAGLSALGAHYCRRQMARAMRLTQSPSAASPWQNALNPASLADRLGGRSCDIPPRRQPTPRLPPPRPMGLEQTGLSPALGGISSAPRRPHA